MNLAIIPARGGSKGIRKKNMRMLCGKPLLSWSIEHALHSELIDRVIVSSDSDEILTAGARAGAEPLLRSSEAASDTASTEAVLREVLDKLGSSEFELVVLLQPTSPLRQPDDTDSAIRKLNQCKADSLFSARHVEGYTWIAHSGGLVPTYTQRRPRQLMNHRLLEENGSIYVFKPWVLYETGKRLGGNVAFYEQHVLDSYQVDRIEDLNLLEQLMSLRGADHSHLL